MAEFCAGLDGSLGQDKKPSGQRRNMNVLCRVIARSRPRGLPDLRHYTMFCKMLALGEAGGRALVSFHTPVWRKAPRV